MVQHNSEPKRGGRPNETVRLLAVIVMSAMPGLALGLWEDGYDATRLQQAEAAQPTKEQRLVEKRTDLERYIGPASLGQECSELIHFYLDSTKNQLARPTPSGDTNAANLLTSEREQRDKHAEEALKDRGVCPPEQPNVLPRAMQLHGDVLAAQADVDHINDVRYDAATHHEPLVGATITEFLGVVGYAGYKFMRGAINAWQDLKKSITERQERERE